MSAAPRRPDAARRLLNRFRVYGSYLRRRTRSTGRPLELNIEITGHCNHRCVFCPQTTMTRPKDHMDPALFEKLIREASGWAELVLLHLGGEPMLHPRFDELLAIARRYRVPTLLSTNAGVLDADRRERLRNNPPDIVIFSIDSTDAETYRALGRTGSFEKTTEWVRSFLAEKPAGELPLTMVQLILMKDNAHQARAFEREWRAAGADLVRIKPYFDFPAVEDYRGTGAPDRGRGRCIYLWRQMAVLWDGRVVACCLDMEGETHMGDANEQSLAEIWNGAPMTELRALHNAGRASEVSPCNDCTMPRLAPWQLAGAVALDADALKSLLPRYEQLVRRIPGMAYF